MKGLFARIADRYDAMNRIMSLGLDRFWRSAAVSRIELPKRCRILDLACGTGDFTAELVKRWPDADITGVDLTPEMLDIARKKLNAESVTFLQGDAQNLSMVGNGTCALVVCAFGFRNFPDKAKALSECARALEPGGRLVVLELFRPGNALLGAAVNAWLTAISWLFASGVRKEYRYLRRSVAGTVSAAEFIAMAVQNGFGISRKRFLFPAATCITFTKS